MDEIIGYAFCPACGNEHSPRAVPIGEVEEKFRTRPEGRLYVVDTDICDACFDKADGVVSDPFFVVEIKDTVAENEIPLTGVSICIPREAAVNVFGLISEGELDNHIFLDSWRFLALTLSSIIGQILGD